jgi:hypothetical protein
MTDVQKPTLDGQETPLLPAKTPADNKPVTGQKAAAWEKGGPSPNPGGRPKRPEMTPKLAEAAQLNAEVALEEERRLILDPKTPADVKAVLIKQANERIFGKPHATSTSRQETINPQPAQSNVLNVVMPGSAPSPYSGDDGAEVRMTIRRPATSPAELDRRRELLAKREAALFLEEPAPAVDPSADQRHVDHHNVIPIGGKVEP